MRIKTLLLAESELLKILPKHLSFIPPPALPLVDVSGWQPPAQPTSKGGKSTKGGKSAKAAASKKGKSTAVKFGKSKKGGPGAR